MMAHFLAWFCSQLSWDAGTLVHARADKKKTLLASQSAVLPHQLNPLSPPLLKNIFQGFSPEYEHPFSTNWQDAAYITLKEADWLVSSCLKAYNKQAEAVSWTRYS